MQELLKDLVCVLWNSPCQKFAIPYVWSWFHSMQTRSKCPWNNRRDGKDRKFLRLPPFPNHPSSQHRSVQVILTHADGIGRYISKYTMGMSARTTLLGHALLPSTKGSAQNLLQLLKREQIALRSCASGNCWESWGTPKCQVVW